MGPPTAHHIPQNGVSGIPSIPSVSAHAPCACCACCACRAFRELAPPRTAPRPPYACAQGCAGRVACLVVVLCCVDCSALGRVACLMVVLCCKDCSAVGWAMAARRHPALRHWAWALPAPCAYALPNRARLPVHQARDTAFTCYRQRLRSPHPVCAALGTRPLACPHTGCSQQRPAARLPGPPQEQHRRRRHTAHAATHGHLAHTAAHGRYAYAWSAFEHTCPSGCLRKALNLDPAHLTHAAFIQPPPPPYTHTRDLACALRPSPCRLLQPY